MRMFQAAFIKKCLMSGSVDDTQSKIRKKNGKQTLSPIRAVFCLLLVPFFDEGLAGSTVRLLPRAFFDK